MAGKTIVVLATMDTKGREAEYLRQQIATFGDTALVIDTGVVGEPMAPPDISRAEVAEAGGMALAKILEHPRPRDRRAGDGRRRGEHRAAPGRRRQGARHCGDGRHPGHHPQHPRHARAALRLPQGDGLDHGLRQRGAVGGHQRHHHDVLGDRHPGPESRDAQDPGERGRRRVRHGGGRGQDGDRRQAPGGRHHGRASRPRAR